MVGLATQRTPDDLLAKKLRAEGPDAHRQSQLVDLWCQNCRLRTFQNDLILESQEKVRRARLILRVSRIH